MATEKGWLEEPSGRNVWRGGDFWRSRPSRVDMSPLHKNAKTRQFRKCPRKRRPKTGAGDEFELAPNAQALATVLLSSGCLKKHNALSIFHFTSARGILFSRRRGNARWPEPRRRGRRFRPPTVRGALHRWRPLWNPHAWAASNLTARIAPDK